MLEAGADDVLGRPVDERELDARVEALDLGAGTGPALDAAGDVLEGDEHVRGRDVAVDDAEGSPIGRRLLVRGAE